MLKEGKREDGQIEGAEEIMTFKESPEYINGTIRPYQLQGLNWMISLHHHGLNGILADESGLGKTLQIISFLGYLKYYRNISGPHLIIVPKSVLKHWTLEFSKWTPDLKVVLLAGSKEERIDIFENQIMGGEPLEILITSYEVCLQERDGLKKLSFEEIVIDEAHRIKDVDSILSQIVLSFTSRGKLLITGTPLQNSIKGLWVLLNFVCPEVFVNLDNLEKLLNKDSFAAAEAASGEVISVLVEKTDTHIDEGVKEKKGEGIKEEGGEGEKTDANKPAADIKPEDSAVESEPRGVFGVQYKALQPFLLRRIKSNVEETLLPDRYHA